MKLKENKGLSLVTFIIILIVLFVLAIGAVVYLLSNLLKDSNIPMENQIGAQININNKKNDGINLNNTINNDEVNDNTKYEKLDLSSKQIQELITKINFEDAIPTLYNRGDFNQNTISNDLILKLGWAKTAKEYNESLTNSLGITTESASIESLKNNVQKIFGNNIKYKDDSFVNVDNTIYTIPSLKVIYDEKLYRVESTGGGEYPYIYQEIKEAKKYNDRIELVVKTAFTDFDYTNVEELGDAKLIIYKDIKEGKPQNKLLEVSSQQDKLNIYSLLSNNFSVDKSSVLSSIYDELNTYIYVFNFDSDTSEYYLTSFTKK